MSLQNKLKFYYKPFDPDLTGGMYYSYGFSNTEGSIYTSNASYNSEYGGISVSSPGGQIQAYVDDTYKSFTFSFGLAFVDTISDETIFTIPSLGIYLKQATDLINWANFLSFYINGIEYATNISSDIVGDPALIYYITLVVDSFGFIKIYNNKDLVSTGFDSNLASNKYISAIYLNNDQNATNTYAIGRYSNIGFWGRPLLNSEISHLIDANMGLVPFIPIDMGLEGFYHSSDLNDTSGKKRRLVGYLADNYNPVYDINYNNPGGILETKRDLEIGLQAAFNFDDALDVVSGQYAGDAVAGGVGIFPQHVEGKIGNCAYFSGWGGYFVPAFNFNKNFTISFWINYSATDPAVILGQNENFSIEISLDGKISFVSAFKWGVPDHIVTTINSVITPNQWYHVCLSVSDGNGSLYVNNTLVDLDEEPFQKFVFKLTNTDNRIVNGIHQENTQYFTIGGAIKSYSDEYGTPYNNTNGDKKLDALYIWNRALSHHEIAELFNNSAGWEISSNQPYEKKLDLESNLIAYYDFENNIKDSSINSNDLTYISDFDQKTGFEKGKVGTSFRINDGINVIQNGELYAPSTSLSKNVTSYTYSFWLICGEPSASGFVNIINRTFQPELTVWSYAAYGLFIEVWRPEGFAGLWVSRELASQWNHYAIVYDQISFKLYVNGILHSEDTGIKKYLTIDDLGDLRIFYNTNGTIPFNGAIDELGIWSRALSVPEIQSIYNNGNGKIITKYSENKSLYYNGGNITLDEDIAYNLNRNNCFSFSFWIKPNSLRPMTIIGGNITDISRFHIYMNSDGHLILDDLIDPNPNTITIPNIFTLIPCHIVISYKEGSLKVYKNGELAFSSAYDASNFIIKNFSIGSRTQGESSTSDMFFHGTLDNVAVWSRYLTPDEALELYNNYIVNNINVDLNDGLMGLYKFNDVTPENMYYDLIEPFTDTLIIKDSSSRRKHLKYNRVLPSPPSNSLVYIPTNGGVGVALANGRSQIKNDNFNFITNETGEITVSIYVGYYFNSNTPINILNLFGNLISIKKDVTPSGGGYSWDYLIYCNGVFVHRISTPFINYFKHHIVVKLNRLTRTAIISHNNNKVYINSLPLFTITNDEFILGDINYGNGGLLIDAIGVWNRGLNDLEIKTLYNNGYQFENFGVDETDPNDGGGYGYYGYVSNNVKFRSNTQIKDNIKII